MNFCQIPGDHGADTTSISSSSDHNKVSNLEGDDVLHFVGGEVQLDAVVHLGQRLIGAIQHWGQQSTNLTEVKSSNALSLLWKYVIYFEMHP